jgi:hypothetical protein
MKQTIRLNESDLHRMIKESVKQVINESAFNNVGDAYNYYISELEDMTSSRDLLGRFIVKVRKKIGEQEVVNILKTIYQEVEQAEKEELAMWDDDYDDFEDETDVY